MWKVWIHEDAEQAAGGLYLFNSEEHARAWRYDNALYRPPSATCRESAISRRCYYDVDERLSAITRGPVAVAAT